MVARFVFAVVSPESTRWFKDELRRNHPELLLAYNRPGLLTFKHQSPPVPDSFALNSVFARHYGISLGQATNLEQLGQFAPSDRPRLGLHVYARDEGEGRLLASEQTLGELRKAILATFADRFEPAERVPDGNWVVDVIVPPPGDEAEGWFVGMHRQLKGHCHFPSGLARKTANKQVPSRAWSKLEEVIAWSEISIRPGHYAVEIGCAPGGAVVSLLDRGLHVTGIDPGAMDPTVCEHAKVSCGSFVHLACPIGAVKREQLPKQVDWLLSDANLAPTVVLRYLAHWSKQLRPKLRGIIFTLKLNDDKMVALIPRLLRQAGDLGFGSVRAVQLPSHRREIVVLATRSS